MEKNNIIAFVFITLLSISLIIAPTPTLDLTNQNSTEYWDELNDPSDINLTDLGNVNATSPSNNFVLTWDSSVARWMAKSAAAASDTNESIRFNNLVGYDCTGTDKVVGVQANGTVLCGADQDSGGGGGNPFDQTLNTTDNVIFNKVSVIDWTNVSITESQISDLNHVGNNELTLDITNITGIDDNACGAGDFINNVSFNNGVLSIVCSTPVGSGDNSSWNQGLASTLYAPINYGDDWNKTYADTLYAAIGSGGNESWNQSYANTLYANIQWDYNQTLPAITYADTTFLPITDLPLANRTTPNWNNITGVPAGFADGIDDVGSGNESWNQSYANTLYEPIGITESDISDLSHTVIWDSVFNTTFDNRDSDTTYAAGTGLDLTTNTFSILLSYRLPQSCTSGQIAEYNGSDWLCGTDDTGGGSSYDQSLNTTDTVSFVKVNSNDWTNVSITESQISDLSHTVIWDATFNTTFDNRDSDTTYTAGSNLTLSATEFSVDMTAVKNYFDGIYQAIGNYITATNVAFTNQTNIFTAHQNMSTNNITDVGCIIFNSGGKICSSP